MQKLLIKLIQVYQNYLSFDKGVLAFFAPGGACKSELKCSEYAKQAMRQYGVITGIKLGLKRIWSCK